MMDFFCLKRIYRHRKDWMSIDHELNFGLSMSWTVIKTIYKKFDFNCHFNEILRQDTKFWNQSWVWHPICRVCLRVTAARTCTFSVNVISCNLFSAVCFACTTYQIFSNIFFFFCVLKTVQINTQLIATKLDILYTPTIPAITYSSKIMELH